MSGPQCNLHAWRDTPDGVDEQYACSEGCSLFQRRLLCGHRTKRDYRLHKQGQAG